MFFIVCFLIAFQVENDTNTNRKYISYYFLILIVCYFSGFRDGLGQDYNNYVGVINNRKIEFSFYEPGYSSILWLVSYSNYSEVLFFLFFAVLTNYLIMSRYLFYSNSFLLCVFIYLSSPVLYYNSFNLVRQFASAAIFLYAIKYIVNRSLLKYFLSVLFASCFHFSSLIFLPIYFFYRLHSKSIYFGLVAITFVFGSLIKVDLQSFLAAYLNIYSYYLLSEQKNIGVGYLGLFILANFILIIIYGDRGKYTNLQVVLFNCNFILVILYNLIPSFSIIHRLTISFIPVLPLIYTLPVTNRFVGTLMKVVGVTFYATMSILFFSHYESTPIVSPSAILLPDSLYKGL